MRGRHLSSRPGYVGRSLLWKRSRLAGRDSQSIRDKTKRNDNEQTNRVLANANTRCALLLRKDRFRGTRVLLPRNGTVLWLRGTALSGVINSQECDTIITVVTAMVMQGV
eukprot:573763-Pyramimonas_sp.AAC.2